MAHKLTISIFDTGVSFLMSAMTKPLMSKYQKCLCLSSISLFLSLLPRLDEVDDLFLAKREIGSSHNLFGEFVGTKMIRYNIVNLNKF